MMAMRNTWKDKLPLATLMPQRPTIYWRRPFRFQTTPHAAHRQYVSVVMTFASVPIARDPHSGQVAGRVGPVSRRAGGPIRASLEYVLIGSA